jgi:hypothetical protein
MTQEHGRRFPHRVLPPRRNTRPLPGARCPHRPAVFPRVNHCHLVIGRADSGASSVARLMAREVLWSTSGYGVNQTKQRLAWIRSQGPRGSGAFDSGWCARELAPPNARKRRPGSSPGGTRERLVSSCSTGLVPLDVRVDYSRGGEWDQLGSQYPVKFGEQQAVAVIVSKFVTKKIEYARSTKPGSQWGSSRSLPGFSGRGSPT